MNRRTRFMVHVIIVLLYIAVILMAIQMGQMVGWSPLAQP